MDSNQSSPAEQDSRSVTPAQQWTQPQKPSSPPVPQAAAPVAVPPQAANASGPGHATLILVGTFFAGLVLGMAAMWAWTENRQNAGITATSTDQGASVASANRTETASTTFSQAEVQAALSGRGTARTGIVAKKLGGTIPSSTSGSVLGIPQQTAGKSVLVSHITVTQPTWAVVYERAAAGFGNALGAKLFISAETSGSIPLLRETLSGKTYAVVLERDNGNRTYELAGDTPLRDASGNPVMVEFTAK